VTRTFTLAADGQVIVYYSVAWQSGNTGGWKFMHTVLWDATNDVEVPGGRSLAGGSASNGVYFLGTNIGFWTGPLQAGTYTYKIKYRSTDITSVWATVCSRSGR
jgi:hypothetical protein